MRVTVTVIMAALIGGLVALGFVLDSVVPDPELEEGGQPAAAATSGAWICTAGNTMGDSKLELIAAAPPDDGGEASTLRVIPFGSGRILERAPQQVFPRSAISIQAEPGRSDLAVLTRWWDVRAAVTRVWHVATQGGPNSLVTGPCQQRPAERWIVPGVATAGGAQSSVVIANPFTSAASVALDLTTPDGIVSPKRLENVVVPERSTVTISLNEHVPEQPDVGVIVRTRSGRVFVEAVQTFDAAIGGIEGTSLAAAAAQPAETWTVPSVALGGEASSWLWVTNPSDEPAALLLALHTREGGLVPEGLEEIIIDPGVTRRVDLVGLVGEATPPAPSEDGTETATEDATETATEDATETATEDVTELPTETAIPTQAAVTVSSDNGVPVVVSGATQYRADREERTGITLTLGAPQLDPSWILSPGVVADRTLVDLVNPSAEAAVVDVSVWSGAGFERPEELTGLRVPPGGSLVVELDTTGMPGPLTIFAAATEGQVVAGVRNFELEGRRNAVAFVGIPSRVFEVAAGAPTVELAPDLPTRLGTRLGPSPPSDPLLLEDDEAP